MACARVQPHDEPCFLETLPSTTTHRTCRHDCVLISTARSRVEWSPNRRPQLTAILTLLQAAYMHEQGVEVPNIPLTRYRWYAANPWTAPWHDTVLSEWTCRNRQREPRPLCSVDGSGRHKVLVRHHRQDQSLFKWTALGSLLVALIMNAISPVVASQILHG